METQMEFSEIEPSFSPTANFLTVGGIITDAALTFSQCNRELLRIEKDGTVIAPDLESASEAGKVFVQAIREQLNFKL
jgi:hypothetical protein